MTRYIKAKIKSQEQIEKVYPEAAYWGKPPAESIWLNFRPADEVILPYLGTTVWVRKKRIDLFDFLYEIKDSDGLVLMPNWIECFESEGLVPPAEWEDPYEERVDDIWLDFSTDRFFVLDDILIVTG